MRLLRDPAIPTMRSTTTTGRIALLWALTLLSTSTVAAALGAEAWNSNWLPLAYLLGATMVNMSLPQLVGTMGFVVTKRHLGLRRFISRLVTAVVVAFAVGIAMFLIDLGAFHRTSGAKTLFDRDYRNWIPWGITSAFFILLYDRCIKDEAQK